MAQTEWQTDTRTWRLYDQLGQEGRVGENLVPKFSWFKISIHVGSWLPRDLTGLIIFCSDSFPWVVMTHRLAGIWYIGWNRFDDLFVSMLRLLTNRWNICVVASWAICPLDVGTQGGFPWSVSTTVMMIGSNFHSIKENIQFVCPLIWQNTPWRRQGVHEEHYSF